MSPYKVLPMSDHTIMEPKGDSVTRLIPPVYGLPLYCRF